MADGTITIDGFLTILAAVLLMAGCLLSAIAGIGLLRFPDLLSRMHAATKPQVLGLLLVLLGLACMWRQWIWVPVLVVAWLMQMITAPVSAHLLGRAAYRTRHLKPEYLYDDELAAVVNSHDKNKAEEQASVTAEATRSESADRVSVDPAEEKSAEAAKHHD